MDRAQKTAQIEEIKDKFSKMASAVLTDFRGIDVESMTALRDEFRKVGVDYKVIKNKLLGIATKEDDFHSELLPFLKDPTAVAWSYDDPSAPAKIIVDFSKKNEKLKIKCAVVDGDILDAQGVVALSKMPGKNELLATLLATFMEPATGFVRLLQAAPTNFVYLLDARRRQLEE
ncbi:MAG: 50S ribosomal protein L10 [Deltaproteobacteria bacterium]|nr:50S ribosomal protein L10 [Deltaproteobacteria bacterium]MBN2672963.1 50S ribosomal protein L10 [Deltaproteobacteria bacterium]